MATLHLKGRISENGELEVELPADVQAGDVDVITRNLKHFAPLLGSLAQETY